MRKAKAQTNGDLTTSASAYREKSRPVLKLPSGAVFQVRRPGPDVAIRAGRLPQNLFSRLQEVQTGQDPEEAGRAFLQNMTDEEFAVFMLFARDMVSSIVVKPKLVVDTTAEDEMDPADLESGDFWMLFAWGMRGGATIPVDMEGGAVSVKDLEKFRDDRSLQSPCADSAKIESSPE